MKVSPFLQISITVVEGCRVGTVGALRVGKLIVGHYWHHGACFMVVRFGWWSPWLVESYALYKPTTVRLLVELAYPPLEPPLDTSRECNCARVQV